MAVPQNEFAPLAYAEQRIKQLEKSSTDKTAAIKKKEREIGLLNSQLAQLKRELYAFDVEQKQWQEARLSMATTPTASASNAPQSKDRPSGNPCHPGVPGEDDEDSEYGDVKAGILIPEEVAAKRKGAEENANAKRQRTTNAADASVRFDAERVLREVADELDDYLPTATTVIKHLTDKFIELRCGVCHTNTSGDGVFLLRGWKGMLEHLVTKHERRMERLLREGSSAHDVVFGHCTFRQLSTEEVEELRDGRKTIQFVDPQRGRPSPEGGNDFEVVTSLQSPKRAPAGRSRTRSPRRLLARECFVCDTKIRADESRLACKYCTTAIHLSCETTLVEPAHGGCRKEPEDHDMNDFELQEPSVTTNN